MATRSMVDRFRLASEPAVKSGEEKKRESKEVKLWRLIDRLRLCSPRALDLVEKYLDEKQAAYEVDSATAREVAELEEKERIRGELRPCTEEEMRQSDWYTHVHPATGEYYFVCDSCDQCFDCIEDTHSAGECNMCHMMNKDD